MRWMLPIICSIVVACAEDHVEHRNAENGGVRIQVTPGAR